MFNKKPVVQEKPSKMKIQLGIDRSKESVEELLDNYSRTIDGYLAKMVNLKKEHRLTEADRYKNKLKLVLARQSKMEQLLDRIEEIQFMVDEAFAKDQAYKTLGTVFGEIGKINMDVQMKDMLKQLKDFDKLFTQQISHLDTMFGKVSRTVGEVNESTSFAQDTEIDAMVNARLEQYDEQTSEQASEDKHIDFSLD